MAIIDTGGSTAGKANVDGNFNLAVTTPATETDAGFTQLSSEVDAGTITGTRRVRALELSENWRLRVGLDTPIFQEIFAGSALNSALFTSVVTTMTTTVAGGFLTLNAGSSVATTVVARVSSYRSIPMVPGGGFNVEIVALLPFGPVANNVTEWGVGIATASAAPTDGLFFRLNAAGEFRCVANNNGTEIQSGSLDFAALVGANSTRHFIIQTNEDTTLFWIDDILVAEVLRGSAGALPTASNQLPILLRTYNTAATSSAQQLKVASINVSLLDNTGGRDAAALQVGAGKTSYQGQTGGTMGTTALFANSANPTAAVPTNTTAALGVGLGGNFWQTNTLAVNTDGIISSYQVPLGTAAIPGNTLFIKAVRIDSAVQTVLANAGAGVYVWSLAFGHTAVSLATAEAATTKAARRVPLGIQTFTGAAAQGVMATEIYVQFLSPIAVQPGEFVQLVLKNIGTVGTAGTIAHVISINGYFE